MVFAAVYAIVVGVAMLGQWSFTILTKRVQGGDVAPEAGGRGAIEMMFHYAAEGATAFVLLIAGAGLLVDMGWALKTYLVGLGMLLYTVVNSPGYFAQKRQWPMVGMFAVLLVLALVSLVLVV